MADDLKPAAETPAANPAPEDEYAFLEDAEFSLPEPEVADSDNPESAEQQTEAKPKTEPEDNPSEKKEDEPDENAVVFQYGDDEIEPGEPAPTEPAETEAQRQQRERFEALERENRELKEKYAPKETELKKPELGDPDIGYDQAKYEAALQQYYEKKAEASLAEKTSQAQREKIIAADNQVYQENLGAYNQRLAAAKTQFPDIDRADSELAALLPEQHAAAIIAAGLENPEMVVYAMHKRPELRDAFMKEQNPIRLGVMLADISKKSRVAPKAKQPPVNKEPEISGSQGANPQDKFFKEFPDAEII